MKKYNQLSEVCITEIKPKGWLGGFLKGQAEGVPGNLHRIGYPFDRACWQYRSLVDGGYAAWWPYEQTAYWIDTIIRTSILTDDEELYERVRYQVEKSFEEDGDPFLGPLELKVDKGRNRWPQMVYFRAILALWAKTGDDRYLKRIYEHYMADTDFDYSKSRDCANVEIMLRLAEIFESEELFKKALDIYARYNALEKDPSYPCVINKEYMENDSIPAVHGVTLNEQGKLAAILYAYTGDKSLLDACIHLYEKIENYHMLPDGVHSSNEFTCGNESYRAHEACDIGDYMWALGYLLEATGDGKYGDRIERACFNALPGAVFPYFKALQYFSCVNQVICTRNSTHLEAWKNTPKMAYQPHHYPECCVGNIGRAMPGYVARMYQRTEEGTAVSLYGPSVYDGEEMRIEQSGNYPFEDTIVLRVSLKQPGKKTLSLRIPSWTKGYTLFVNGKKQDAAVMNGYITIPVLGDEELRLTFRKGFMSHASADGGIYYTYGPFVMTLKIRENCVIDTEEKRQTKEFPAYNIYPESEWRYAVNGWEQPQIIEHDIPENPFWDGVPFEIRIPARRLRDWDFVKCSQADKPHSGGEGIDAGQKACGATEVLDDLVLTPRITTADVSCEQLGEEEMITLIPYGCSRLRLTVFPRYNRDDLARQNAPKTGPAVKNTTQGT